MREWNGVPTFQVIKKLVVDAGHVLCGLVHYLWPEMARLQKGARNDFTSVIYSC